MTEQKNCPRCNSRSEMDARFCGVCGTSLASTAPLAAATGTPPSTPHPRPPSVPTKVPTPSPAALIPMAITGSGPHARSSPVPLTRVPAPPTMDSLLGRTLNQRFLVKRKIGEGGFGAVFEGVQLAAGRDVALKILLPKSATDATIVARFRREAEACSKLRNPHTVILYDFDQTEDGVLYLAMELVRGRSLQAIQKTEGILAPDRCLRILEQVSQALGEAHALGIVHRDMKPENIMVEEREGADYVKVLDFGIAKIISEEGSRGAPALTAVGQTVGTLEFMSPEQLRGKPLDGRSDIYALGMVAYEILTGELPFKNAKASTEVIQYHLHEPPPAPSSLNPDAKIPLAVDELIQKMVAKLPEHRHPNAEALGDEIAAALASLDPTTFSWETKRFALILGALLALALTALFLLR